MSEVIRDTFIHLHSQNLVGQLREEFLERYGDHCIPIVNARQIAQAAQEKKLKNVASPVEGAEGAEETVATTEGASAPKTKTSAKDESPMSAAEVAELAGDKGKELPEIVVAGQRFVRLRDLIPDAPPRGQFNVERVRGSQYFFS